MKSMLTYRPRDIGLGVAIVRLLDGIFVKPEAELELVKAATCNVIVG